MQVLGAVGTRVFGRRSLHTSVSAQRNFMPLNRGMIVPHPEETRRVSASELKAPIATSRIVPFMTQPHFEGIVRVVHRAGAPKPLTEPVDDDCIRDRRLDTPIWLHDSVDQDLIVRVPDLDPRSSVVLAATNHKSGMSCLLHTKTVADLPVLKGSIERLKLLNLEGVDDPDALMQAQILLDGAYRTELLLNYVKLGDEVPDEMSIDVQLLSAGSYCSDLLYYVLELLSEESHVYFDESNLTVDSRPSDILFCAGKLHTEFNVIKSD